MLVVRAHFCFSLISFPKKYFFGPLLKGMFFVLFFITGNINIII